MNKAVISSTQHRFQTNDKRNLVKVYMFGLNRWPNSVSGRVLLPFC